MNKPNIIGICFAFIYLLICFALTNFEFDRSWGGGFLCFLLALPFSILSLGVLNYVGGKFIFFIISNAIWWGVIGFCIGKWIDEKKHIRLFIVIVGYIVLYSAIFISLKSN